MNRRTGEIPRLTKDTYPSRFVVFDTEAWRSDPVSGVEVQTLRLGVARLVDLGSYPLQTKGVYLTFHTVDELGSWLEWLTLKDHSLYVYAHNLKYDLQLSGLYTWLVGRGWRTLTFVFEDPPTFIKLKRGRMSLVMVDTFNYWQTSVEAMGKQLGLDKLSMPAPSVTDEGWFKYCQRDVDVLTDYLLEFIRFLQDNRLCGLGLTLASQAFRSYRHRFMHTDIILHDDKRVLKLERAGYYGGRCEAYHIGDPGDPPYYKLDVNSMYPYVMRERCYPTELVSYAEGLPLERLPRLLDKYYCLALVDLHTPDPAYAYTNGVKLLFPVGRFTTPLHHEELIKAYHRGELEAIKQIAVYERGYIFRSFVDYFYALKLQAEEAGDPVTRHQCKILLNSLYGKFGQRRVISKIVPYNGAPRYGRLTGYCEPLRCNVVINYLGNTVEIRYKSGEAFYSFPAIAGAVTTYARAYLWELILQAGRSNVFYCDTDSMIVNRAGYDNLSDKLHPSDLGMLKLEGQSDSLWIHNLKDYAFGSEVKIKGIPRTARKLSDNLWEYHQFRGSKTWVKDGMRSGVEVYTRYKQRLTQYDKGIVLPGGLVLPLRLDRAEDG